MFKEMIEEKGVHLCNTDRGNVLLFNVLTLNERYVAQNNRELKAMSSLSKKYHDRGLSIIGVFAYDIETGE